MPERKPLNPKHERFCQEYLVDLDASKAAARAGYSDKSRGQIGWQLLLKPPVQERIKELNEARFTSTAITSERILQEYARIAFADITDFIEWDGTKATIKPFGQLTEDQQAVISEFYESDTPVGTNRRIKFHSKLDALNSLAKHKQLFIDKVEVTGEGGGPIPVQIYLPDNGR